MQPRDTPGCSPHLLLPLPISAAAAAVQQVRPPLTHPTPLAACFCATGHAAPRSGDQMAVSAHHRGRGRARRSAGRVRRFGFGRAGASARACLFFCLFPLNPPPPPPTTSPVTFYANKRMKTRRHGVHLHPSITMRTNKKNSKERYWSGGVEAHLKL